ncbi:MAG: glycosyltransferase family 39 protein [Hyphomonadaceae bacterium]|nr:glycosyltransferase family 39 protein [Hyphomonadaceae bacterium]
MATPVSPALFDQFARGWRGYVLIALIALTSGLLGATRVPVTDVDEARFAQATRQMIETDDYLRIRVQDAERNRKPVGIYWLQAASVNALRPHLERLNTIWPYRLPSALGLMLASLATLWAGATLFGRREGVVGAAIFAVGLLAGVEGMLANTDAVMTGFTALALAALAQLRAGTTRPRIVSLAFWIAIGCGIMIKGPITPLVALLTLATLVLWERRAAWARPLAFWPGPVLALAITLPWLIAIGVATGGRFYTDFLLHEIGPKLVSGGDHRHGGIPGYYLLWLPLLIFPASYALPAAARLAWSTIRAPRDDDANAPFRFLIAWATPTFLFFEIMPAKLIHYTLPAYPAIALMCAAGLFAMRGKRWRTAHPAGLVLFGVSGALFVAAMAVVSTFMPGYLADAGVRRAVATALIGAATVGAAIVGLILLRRPTTRAIVLVACALTLSFSLRERLLPEARTLFVSNEAAATMTRARLTPQEGQNFWIVGYEQPSIIFLTRTWVRLVEIGNVAQTPINAGDGIMIEGRVFDQAQAALSARGLEFEAADQPARGMAIGRGEYMTLNIGRVREIASGSSAASPQPDP